MLTLCHPVPVGVTTVMALSFPPLSGPGLCVINWGKGTHHGQRGHRDPRSSDQPVQSLPPVPTGTRAMPPVWRMGQASVSGHGDN